MGDRYSTRPDEITGKAQGLDIEVSINISGYHMESPHFTERLQQQLAHYPGMPFGKLQIEVLETVALNDIAIVREIIEACRNIGVGICAG
jgi:EAL domain-containing protein (putative c-di-GMP-specific phosphodiesterase class I)